ncbi:transmembrane protein, putative (macronuclear) [Tetrahymena thermophila SB210]|uniref:Transmembrane protein, putative n=1 Tax=Tetrahymena thermophila (strain SB210) TaxID=312017 RepID=I7LU54_TETTS|nr:transmembrane protein, putative [Tetrahymena thermophila SB210]EAR89925.2 transmembrane protein, putative [Tetrahymena thermophila SB210]|eukprot:XP_001010170.2 transmembrane protein, putative [Tetrahymena thermophila SB210]
MSQNIIGIKNADISTFEDFRDLYVIGFNIPIFLGTPSQTLTVTMFLSSPVNITFAQNLNMIFNSECSVQNMCPYAISNLGIANLFYEEKKSSSLKSIINKGPKVKTIENQIFHGNNMVDQIKFAPNEISMEMNFVSISHFNLQEKLNDGIIDLSSGNQNNIFTQGYLQKKLISPKFSFSYDKIGRTDLRFNYNDQILEQLPALPTYSKQFWDFQMVGMFIENINVLPLAHFQTVVIQFYIISALPRKIVEYLNQEYSQYFLKGGRYNQLNQEVCFKEISFLDIVIYTKEYKFVIPIRYFFYLNNDLQCKINVSKTNVLFGIQQIQDQNIVFDPLNSTLQFPKDQQMKHLSIYLYYPIFLMGSIKAGLLVLLFIKLNNTYISLLEENDKWKLIFYQNNKLKNTQQSKEKQIVTDQSKILAQKNYIISELIQLSKETCIDNHSNLCNSSKQSHICNYVV